MLAQSPTIAVYISLPHIVPTNSSTLTDFLLSAQTSSIITLVANVHSYPSSATSRPSVFPSMFSFLIVTLALAASTVSGHSNSPSAAALITGTPFDMSSSATPTPAPELAARQDWVSPPALPTPPAWSAPPVPSAPAWSQPLVPTVPTVVITATTSPTPSQTYTWEETHDDSKNTKKHELIALIIVCTLVGLVLVIFVPCMLWHKCRNGRIKNKGMQVPDVEEGVAQFRVMPQQPQPLVHATRVRDGGWTNVPL